MKYSLFFNSILMLLGMCNGDTEVMEKPEIGIWKIYQEDRLPDYKIQYLDFADKGKLTMDFDVEGDGLIERKMNPFYEIRPYNKNPNTIYLRWDNAWYFWAYVSINGDEMTLEMVRDDRVIRYKKIK